MGASRWPNLVLAVVLGVATIALLRPDDTGGAGQQAAPALAGSTITVSWQQEQPVHNPPTRMLTSGQMAYDAANQSAVFFGGQQTQTGDLPEDTWVYSAGGWSSPATTPHPDARMDSPMAYDPVHQQVVMYGGSADFLGFGKRDTWLWDGSGWRLAHPTAAPLPRAGPGMAWDPVSQRVLLYGGTFHAGPRPEGGFAVSARLPFAP